MDALITFDVEKNMFRSNTILGKRVSNLFPLLLVFTFASLAVAQPEPGDERAITLSVDSKLTGFFAGEKPTSIDQIELVQEHVQTLAEKVQKTVVGIGVGAAQGSGVIISRDGYVLTAAHVSGQAGRNAVIFLSDGRRIPARTLGLNRTFDAGLMKIAVEDWEEQNWPHADMGVSNDIELGEWVMAVGHPGGFQVDRNPVVRLGRIVHTYEDVLTSDCTLIGGDSGGPLFSMDGRVVGIHSRIGPELSHNVHAPIDSFKEGWERMTNQEQWGNTPGAPLIGVTGGQNDDAAEIESIMPGSPAALAGIKKGDIIIRFAGKDITTFDSLVNVVAVHRPGEKVIVNILRNKKELEIELTIGRAGPRIPQPPEEDSSFKAQPIANDYNSWMSYIASYKPATVHQRNYETIVNAFAPVVNKAGNSTIRISDGQHQLALGVVISADGYILTKASEILSDELEFPLSCSDRKGNIFEATFISHRPKFDLLMLKADTRKLKPIKWNIDEQPLGSWLISPSISENPMAIGVVSAHPRSIRGGLLGVFLGETPDGVRVEQVFPNTAAARAKMQRGDIILKVNDIEITDREQLINTVRSHLPGEKITLHVRRGEEELAIDAVLGREEDIAGSRAVEQQNLGGPLSSRRSGFQSVLQHDTILRPEQCGGPILNTKGQAIGINIARATRVASYALPASVIVEVIDEMKIRDADLPVEESTDSE